MKKIFLILFLLFPFEIFGGEAVDQWPDLSKIKHVSGRVATQQDINEGAAVFMLQSEGVPIGSPMKIEIPQYAIHTNVETNEKTRVIIIQAEEAKGQHVVGALDFSTNEIMAGLFHEFTLLGADKPNKEKPANKAN